MSVQDVRKVTVPSPSEPADPPLASSTPAPPAHPTAGIPGHARPYTKEEREFVLSIGVVFGVLATMIVTFLLLAEYVWS